MKIKQSSFIDYACILPGVQQVVGIPVALYHLVQVVKDVIQKIIIIRNGTPNINKYCNERIFHFKQENIEILKKYHGTNNPMSRAHREEFTRNYYEIKHCKSLRIDPIAKISELGYATLRCIPIIGSVYSAFVYFTSNDYMSIIPRFECGQP